MIALSMSSSDPYLPFRLLEKGEKIQFEEHSEDNGNLALMIIKGLFRRYERWNPVHPTSGAFWGMGIGVGCGVGWGPGFGPEVIGYVGAGCGVGFNVGITLAGVGIGLPANFLIEFPNNAYTATRTCASVFARSNDLFSVRKIKGDVWSHVGPRISGLQREASGRIPGFNLKHSLEGISLTEMKKMMDYHARPILEGFGAIKNHCLPPHRGCKD